MYISDLPKVMFICLICTIFLELIPALILGVRTKTDIINIILVNIITNPVVVLTSTIVGLKYGYNTKMIYMIIIELIVVITEGLIYKKVLDYKKINPIILSLILNCSSYFLGEIINNIIY